MNSLYSRESSHLRDFSSVRDASGKDVPLVKDGKQLTLREALADLAARGDVGAGGLIELDTDGRPLR